jgi:serine/threonine protein kinase
LILDEVRLITPTHGTKLTDLLFAAQKVVDKPRTRKIGSCALRAPEVLLKIPYDTKVDIWALGCTVRVSLLVALSPLCQYFSIQTFEPLTGMRLFDPQSSGEKQSECGDSGDESSSDEEDDPASGDDAISQSVDDRDESWSRGEDHLAKMIEVTGEVFPSDLASTSSLGRKYFDDAGT